MRHSHARRCAASPSRAPAVVGLPASASSRNGSENVSSIGPSNVCTRFCHVPASSSPPSFPQVHVTAPRRARARARLVGASTRLVSCLLASGYARGPPTGSAWSCHASMSANGSSSIAPNVTPCARETERPAPAPSSRLSNAARESKNARPNCCLPAQAHTRDACSAARARPRRCSRSSFVRWFQGRATKNAAAASANARTRSTDIPGYSSRPGSRSSSIALRGCESAAHGGNSGDKRTAVSGSPTTPPTRRADWRALRHGPVGPRVLLPISARIPGTWPVPGRVASSPSFARSR